MGGVGDVSGDGDELAEGAQPVRRGGELLLAAGVRDDLPAVAQQGGGEGESEPAGGSGDDGDGHGADATPGLVGA
jgi:hypothetical protein